MTRRGRRAPLPSSRPCEPSVRGGRGGEAGGRADSLAAVSSRASAPQVVHDLGPLVNGPTRDALERGTVR